MKKVLGSRNGMYKGPEVGVCPTCLQPGGEGGWGRLHEVE